MHCIIRDVFAVFSGRLRWKLLFCLWVCSAIAGWSQTQPSPTQPSQESTQQQQTQQSPDQKTQKKDQISTAQQAAPQLALGKKKKEGDKRGAFVAAPIPTSSAAIGTGIQLMAGYIFPISKNDKISPPSVLGGLGLITNNGTTAWGVGTELYFKQDQYKVLTGYAHGDLNYNFYGTGTAAGNLGLSFGINQVGDVFFGSALRRIFYQFFIGPRFWFGNSTLAPQHLHEDFPNLPPLHVGFVMRAIGLKVERDTTPNRFYPLKGSMINFSADFFSQDIGGTFSFQTYRFAYDKFHSYGPKQVLAYNAYVCSTGGRAPFFGQCIFGMQNELRGYPAGRYIDKDMLAAQVEYRRILFWRLGAVAFGGLGEVGPSWGEFNYTNLLPSVGGGARFNLSTKYHVNLRADIAQGRDEHTFSMGLGEAF
jgi:hypothetical protein